MNEALFQFIWKYQLFEKSRLETHDGEVLKIFYPGKQNTEEGPDFLDARILIGNLEWAGPVELHLRSSDWYRHGHSKDENYASIILHVVLIHDKEVSISGGIVSVLELEERISAELIERNSQLMRKDQFLPCQKGAVMIHEKWAHSMLKRAAEIRLKRKSETITAILLKEKGDWDATCYKWLILNFSFGKNQRPLKKLGELLPWKVVSKHLNNLDELMALFFGVSGLLAITRSGPNHLSAHFELLRKKYGLELLVTDFERWKRLRLRPNDYPERKLSQMAMLLFKGQTLLQKSLIGELGQWFSANDQGSLIGVPFYPIGERNKYHFLVNFFPPLWVAYSKYSGNIGYEEKAKAHLLRLKAEKNSKTDRVKPLVKRYLNAYETQGAIELYDHFCTQNQCLSCEVGINLLKETALCYS